MLQNARLTAFTVSELLRENQKGAEEGKWNYSPLRLELSYSNIRSLSMSSVNFWIQSSMLSSRNSHPRRQGKQLLKGILQNGCQNFADTNCWSNWGRLLMISYFVQRRESGSFQYVFLIKFYSKKRYSLNKNKLKLFI